VTSDSVPLEGPAARALAVEAWRRAEAMGLVEPGGRRLEPGDLASLVERARDAGIGRAAALRLDNVDAVTPSEAEALLRMLVAALEASPVPRNEWPAVTRVLDAEHLASLLNISLSSLRRYAAGERDTPDTVAARLHLLALVVGDLAGAYNEVGVRRWFTRPRTALDGRAPQDLLAGEWHPEDQAAQRVRALAASLVSLSAT
jgi:hypothetical protein